jgi:hypothetical protein
MPIPTCSNHFAPHYRQENTMPIQVTFYACEWFFSMLAGQEAWMTDGEWGICIFFGSNLVSWSARKQHIVSRFSTEEKYKAILNATVEIMWIQTLLQEHGIHHSSDASLWCDNLGATYLLVNLVFYSRTKHIKLDCHFVRERVARKQLDIHFISPCDQVTDSFTKTLSLQKLSSNIILILEG